MNFKKILAAFTSALMLCGMTACSNTETSSGTSTAGVTNNGVPVSPGVLRGAENLNAGGVSNSPADSDRVYKIGISKMMDHPALNLSEGGFVQALTDSGFVIGENLMLEYRNGEGDTANLDAIADEFISANDDLIFAIATPAAQACANKTTKIPIIATAVTDFVDAGLIKSNSRPGTNVSGTTDMSPVAEQIDLMLEVFPEIETIGFVYTASESNSALQISIAREYAESLGLNTVEITLDGKEDIPAGFSAIIPQCDAIYLPTDNMLASEMPTVAAVCNPAKKPVFCAESGMVETGGFGTLAIDYRDLGYQAGLMAVKVLNGSNIDGMSIQKSTRFEYSFNGATIEALETTIPVKYREYIN